MPHVCIGNFGRTEMHIIHHSYNNVHSQCISSTTIWDQLQIRLLWWLALALEISCSIIFDACLTRIGIMHGGVGPVDQQVYCILHYYWRWCNNNANWALGDLAALALGVTVLGPLKWLFGCRIRITDELWKRIPYIPYSIRVAQLYFLQRPCKTFLNLDQEKFWFVSVYQVRYGIYDKLGAMGLDPAPLLYFFILFAIFRN